MNNTYTAANGVQFTDDDIERWATLDEAPDSPGYTGAHGPVVMGRPVSVGYDAKPFTLRLDGRRRAKLDQAAKEQQITVSQVVRDLIDAL